MSDGLRARLRPAARQVRDGRAWLAGASGYIAGRDRDVRVSYGHFSLPSRDEPAVGGIVKLQSLSEVFPNTPLRYNVLYLVSSRLPDGAVILARWAKRKGARFVLNQNGVAYPGWYGDGWESINAPMRTLLSMADHVFYQSEFCRISADRFAGPPAGPWEILHNAVDVEMFTPRTDRRDASALTLLLGGSQDMWYRYASAIDTLALLVRDGINARLIVTGRLGWTKDAPAARKKADDYARERGVSERVEFTGPYTQAQAPAIFRRADVLLHTKYNDPCPAVVVEALASGLPVAFSASGGVPELVGDAGLGVDAPRQWDRDVPPDPPALAAAVTRIAGNRDAFARLARQRAVDHLNLRAWLDRHRAVFAVGQS